MRTITFSNADTRAVFATRDFADFSQLMLDTALGKEQVDKKAANDKIREVMFEILGVDASCDRKTLRNAIRRHKVDVFEVVETIVPDLLVSGWGSNPFFNEFVEMKSAAIGDTNEFYVPDETILTVAEVSGNHHDFNCLRVRIA